MNNIPDYDKDRKAFALFAGKVLQPDKNKHNWFTTGMRNTICTKCRGFKRSLESEYARRPTQ